MYPLPHHWHPVNGHKSQLVLVMKETVCVNLSLSYKTAARVKSNRYLSVGKNTAIQKQRNRMGRDYKHIISFYSNRHLPENQDEIGLSQHSFERV